MKKIGKTLFLSTAMISIIGVASINAIENSDALVQFIAPQAYPDVIEVHNWEEFEAAIEKTGTQERTIVLANDIDLSGFTPSDTANIVSLYPLEIDGNGYSFYNKPAEYFFAPLIKPVDDGEKGITRLYVHNLTFDNAGYLFENDTGVSPYDYGIGGATISETNSIYFQDITVKNIDLSNQTWNNVSSSKYGLLFGNVTLYESGLAPSDNSLTLSDIKIEDNIVSNNVINLSNNQSTFSFSPLGNLTYRVCLNPQHYHQGFVNLNNIQIKNNKFMNNTINSTNSNLIYSYGNVFGSFSGLQDWTGTSGNFLNISNVLMENNIIENPNGITSENFQYSTIISNPIATSDQETSIENIENIYAINNIIISDFETKKLYNQEDIVVINMLNLGTNDWASNASNSMMFIGPNYNHPETSINVVAGETGSELNDIYHAPTLATSQLKYSILNSAFLDALGIYGYDLTTRKGSQLNEEFGQYGLNLNPNERYLTTINLASDEDQVIFYNAVVEKSDSLVYDLQVDFKYLQANALKNPSVTTPYVLNNVTLSEGPLEQGEILASDNQGLTTIAEINYIYSVNFEWVDGLDISTIDLNNLYLSFEYLDEISQFTHEVSIKIESSEIINFRIHNVDKTSGTTTTIIASATALVLFLILLLFIILFLLWYRRKRQLEKFSQVQDGYFEYLQDIPNQPSYDNFAYAQGDDYYSQPIDYQNYYDNQEINYYNPPMDYQGDYDNQEINYYNPPMDYQNDYDNLFEDNQTSYDQNDDYYSQSVDYLSDFDNQKLNYFEEEIDDYFQ